MRAGCGERGEARLRATVAGLERAVSTAVSTAVPSAGQVIGGHDEVARRRVEVARLALLDGEVVGLLPWMRWKHEAFGAVESRGVSVALLGGKDGKTSVGFVAVGAPLLR